MQAVVPTFVAKISNIRVCRDPLTSISRGVCYLMFDNLVDSMNVFTALKELNPPLVMDNREIIINYCVDAENKRINESMMSKPQMNNPSSSYGPKSSMGANYQYTLADVPRLAEYSSGVYASTPEEYEHYYKYYSDYYISQINSGQFSNLPTINQMGETANSGAAVALSAIQRLQKTNNGNNKPTVAATPAEPVQVPNGTDGKKYREYLSP